MAVAFSSMGVWLPSWLRQRWTRLALEEGHWRHRQEFRWGVALWLTIATAGPTILLVWGYQGLNAMQADRGGGLLSAIEWVASQIGILPG